MVLEDLIRVAHGDKPADLLITNIKLVNLLSAEIYPTSVAVYAGKIAGFGEYEAREVIDGQGNYLAAGLIEGHVHIESSMLTPREFAMAVVPHGTTTVIADPHEIINVMGMAGLQYMLAASENLPIDIYYMLSSCVPATHLENAGAVITAEEMQKWIGHPRILGIGEMMNFPGVIGCDPQVLRKIENSAGKVIDGHAPLVLGKDLSAYIAAGISSDHESTEFDEALEKLRKGLFVMIRECSAARNLEALLPIVNQLNAVNCGFVTDDPHPDFLMDSGHIDSIVRLALSKGCDPIMALQMASINTARHFGLRQNGAVAPGYDADLILFDDFENFKVRQVFKAGRKVAEDGQMLITPAGFTETPKNSMHPAPLADDAFCVPARGREIWAIEIIPHQIITRKLRIATEIVDGLAVGAPDRDLLKIAVVERHHATGNIGLGFVKGMGLQHGAIASTVAHDSHNIVVVGTNDADMLIACQALVKMCGGKIVVANGQILAALPLPIAGLLSDQPLAQVRAAADRLNQTARELGCIPENPFMTLSFLSLPVIPELKLTDRGLVDVIKFDFIELFAV
ncbi:MAG: adenine deaminase [Candidatus Marinimicrobia bacterium]|jgi:adenine deaminase|nr:adenine deaminase [Candidatus Neomarinimicrobiota bacterium]MCK9484158.1 adenine deaminase [Candidatus Neomarinimicrobiota bacterium]MCK9559657.1 adenine deaminase [Candidatus Neomarinimicrobiota bacterium]MDD5229774.1 adenine deaminase [Candidatus Neomarinimicrobiota bacterium]